MLNSDVLKQLKQLKQDIKEQHPRHRGTVKGSNGRFGFLMIEGGADLFLPPDEMLKVFPGDEIEVTQMADDKGKPWGKIEKLIRSPLKKLAGKVVAKDKNLFIAPEVNGLTRWLFIPPQKQAGAQAGDYVVGKVTRHPIKNGKPQVEVTAVIGNDETPGIERAFMIAKHQLADSWSEQIQQALKDTSTEITDQQREAREDLTGLPFVTIDASTTQDMDDALQSEATDSGWILRVAVADPTAVISENNPLRKEASKRGATHYFPGGPVAMLPAEIANKACSLLPDTDRLALVCEMQVSQQGEVSDYRFINSIIRSRHKLSYDDVANWLDHKADSAVSEELQEPLSQLQAIAGALGNHRKDHALVNDDKFDYRLQLNDQGKIESVLRIENSSSRRLVEECMVAANRCAADLLSQQGTGLFVTHAGLRAERLPLLKQVLEAHAPELCTVDLDSLEGFLQIVKAGSDKTVEGVPLNTLVMRQLERSEISAKPLPHLGMGLQCYTTFTSPLRKYVDFLVHDMIRDVLAGKTLQHKSDAEVQALQEKLLRGRHAVNETESWLKCQFARSLLKQTFSGRIHRLNPTGFFVRLDESGLEVFVSTKDMEGKYSFDTQLMKVTGPSQTFVLDQPLDVTISRIDAARRTIIAVLKTDQQDTTEAEAQDQ